MENKARTRIENYAHVKAWRKNNKDKVNAQARRRYAKHPEKIKAVQARFRARNLDRVRAIDAERAQQRRKRDPEGNRRRVKAFKERQHTKRVIIAGRPRPDHCELCRRKGRDAHGFRIVYDHCHTSNKFRGWICDRCNKVLGLILDDPSLARKMAKYLETHRTKTDKPGQKHADLFQFCASDIGRVTGISE